MKFGTTVVTWPSFVLCIVVVTSLSITWCLGSSLSWLDLDSHIHNIRVQTPFNNIDASLEFAQIRISFVYLFCFFLCVENNARVRYVYIVINLFPNDLASALTIVVMLCAGICCY